ncbi:MAG TPA: tetratricopeptide repeat protein [Bryobacteraceae bacterium]|nr:tetratricopeptide repeat protein [Bryobacteraceae bacterium]
MSRRILLLALLAGSACAQDAAQTAPTPPPDIDSLVKTARAGYTKGDYAPARDSLEQAWKIADQLSPKDAQRIDVLKFLVAVDSAMGDYKAAQYNQELAINWRENNNGKDDPKLVDEWIEMSTICARLKDFNRALALIGFARGRHMMRDGASSLSVADDWSREALIEVAQGTVESRDRAIQSLRWAIQVREAVLGTEHPATLAEVDRLAAVYITQRIYDKAEETFRRAIVIRERLSGRNDAGLINSVEGLAYAQYGQKEWDDAEANYKRLMNLWVMAASDPNYPMVALVLDKLVAFYREQEKWEQADAAEAGALAIRGYELAQALRHEAVFELSQKKMDETVALLKRALAALDASRPDLAPGHQKMRDEIAEALKQLEPEKPAAPKHAPRTPAPAATKSTKQR